MMDIFVLGSFIWLFVVFPLLALIHCSTHKDKSIKSKLIWCLAVLSVPALGAVIYGIGGSGKKPIKILSAISFICFLILTSFTIKEVRRLLIFSSIDPTSATPSIMSLNDLDSDSNATVLPRAKNAATYYQKALRDLVYPDSAHLKDQIKFVTGNEWDDPDGTLLEILKSNQKAIGQWKIGVRQKDCDFYFGKKVKYTVQREIYQYSPIINLSKIVILNGKLLENQNRYTKAGDLYLSLLKQAIHLSQDVELIGRAIGIAITDNALDAIDQLIAQNNSKPKLQQDVHSFLTGFRINMPEGSYLIEPEKFNYISTMELLADSADEVEFPEGITSEQVELLSNAIKKNSVNLADRYYGNYINAANSNQKSDWDIATNEIDRLGRKYRMKSQVLINGLVLIYYGITGKQDAYTDSLTGIICEITLVAAMPNLKELVDKHYVNVERLDGLIHQTSPNPRS